MKKSCLLLSSLFMVSAAFVANADDSGVTVGADAQWRFNPLQKNAGGNLVKDNYLQGNVYGGWRFSDNFGFELGYERTAAVKTKKSLTDPVSYFSGVITGIAPDYILSNVKVSMQAFHGGLVGSLPISDEYRLKLIAYLGLARVKAKIGSSANLLTPAGAFLNSLVVNFAGSKWVPKLGMGVQHMMNDNVGLRATAGWEQTSKLKGIKGVLSSGATSAVYRASLKDSINLGLGMFYNF